MLGAVGVGEPHRVGAVGNRHPQPVERGEGKHLAVRRRRRVANLTHGEGGRVLDRVVEIDPWPQRQLHLHPERDLLGVPALDRQLPHPAPVGNHQVTRIRRERHARKHVQRRARLLVVVLHRMRQPALLAGFQVSDQEPGLVVVAGPENQPASIGRERGPHRRPVARRLRIAFAVLPVVGLELVLRELGVVLPVAGAARVPDVAPVGRDRGPRHLHVVGLRDELDTAAAVHVEHLQLGQISAPEVADRRDHVVSVRHPFGRLGAIRRAAGHLHRVGAVQRHDPDVLAPVVVRGVDDARAVGREAGLGVEGHAGGELGRRASLDGDGEEVAQEVEDDGLPVGAHVQRDPASLRHVDGDGPVDGKGQVLVLGGGVVPVRSRRILRQRALRGEGGGAGEDERKENGLGERKEATAVHLMSSLKQFVNETAGPAVRNP